MDSAFRQPLYRIELPGYPILSDGKADNQNHALPFSRGTITQCVDSNQGAVGLSGRVVSAPRKHADKCRCLFRADDDDALCVGRVPLEC